MRCSMTRTSATRSLSFSAFILLLAPLIASAQVEQTSEGAQIFLSKLVNQGNVEARVRLGHVASDYTETRYVKKMLRGWVTELQSKRSGCALDADGSHSSSMSCFPERAVLSFSSSFAGGAESEVCNSLITQIRFLPRDTVKVSEPDFNESYSTYRYAHEKSLMEALALPLAFDWRQANVSRNSSSVTAQAPHSRFKNVTLSFNTSDPGMLDRIEYAARFLTMNCDVTVGTGF